MVLYRVDDRARYVKLCNGPPHGSIAAHSSTTKRNISKNYQPEPVVVQRRTLYVDALFVDYNL